MAHGRTVWTGVAGGLLLALLLAPFPASAASAGTAPPQLHLTEDDSHRETVRLAFPGAGKQQFDLRVGTTWQIQSASVSIRGSETPVDPRAPYAGRSWPSNVHLDLGADQADDWSFGGTMGYQYWFAPDLEQVDLALQAGSSSQVDLVLPPGQVTDARLVVQTPPESAAYFRLAVGSPEAVVWERPLLSFEPGQVVAVPSSVRGLAVGNLDYPFNVFTDVAVAADSQVATLMNNGPQGGMLQSPRSLASGDPAGVVAIARGDIEGNDLPDLAVAGPKETIMVLRAVGGGNFRPAEILPTVGYTPVALVLADVDGDMDQDVVAGTLSGDFVVVRFDAGTERWGAAEAIPGGRGPVNAVAVVDLDGDQLPDLVGANEDNTFHWAKGGTGTFVPQPPIAGKSGGTKSLVAVDIDGDRDIDLIGASGDGTVILATNMGDGTFDKQTPFLVSSSAVGALVAGDLDGDSDTDLLAAGQDGWLHLLENLGFGQMAPSRRVIEVGTTATALGLGDFDDDKDLDVAVGRAGPVSGVAVFLNRRGPVEETVHEGLAPAIQTWLDAQAGTGGQVTVPLHVSADGSAGTVSLLGLAITYNWTARVDLMKALTRFVENHKALADAEGFLRVPVVLSSATPGALEISAIDVAYIPTIRAVIREPRSGAGGEGPTIHGDLPLNLSCRASGDEAVVTGDVRYTWQIHKGSSGPVDLGTGADLAFREARDLGKVGPGTLSPEGFATITCVAEADAGIHIGQLAAATTTVQVLAPLGPELRAEFRASAVRLTEGERLRIIVEVANPSIREATDVEIVVVERLSPGPGGAIRGREVGRTTIDRLAGGAAIEESIALRPAKGPHSYSVELRGAFRTASVDPASIDITVDPAPIGLPIPDSRVAPVVLSVLVLGLLGAVAATTEVGKLGFLTLLLPLYSRLKQEEVLDNEMRGTIRGFVVANPGEHFNAIRDALELNNGALAYHLRVLEREGYVKSQRDGLFRRFYPAGRRIANRKYLSMQQNVILEQIRGRPGITQTEIAKATNTSLQVINYYIQQLETMDLVTVEKEGRTTHCFLRDDKLVMQEENGRYFVEAPPDVEELPYQ